MPPTSLSPITLTTPTRNRKSNSSASDLRQRRRTCGVVRGVDEHRRRAAHPLQPAGADRGGESRSHRVDVELTLRAGAEERLDRGEGDRRIVCLVFAVQRQEHLGVDPAQALQLEQLAANRDLAPQHRELRILARDSGIGTHGLRQHDLHGLRHLTPDDRDGVRGASLRSGG